MRKLRITCVLLLLILSLAGTILAPGCKSDTSISPAATATSSAPQKVLKIGYDCWSSAMPGLNWVVEINLIAETINKSGGLDVGGEKYKIEPIIYDNNANQNTAVTVANRLIYEDKVKFLMCDQAIESVMPIAEKEKVVLYGIQSPIPDSYSPKYNYTYFTGYDNCKMIVAAKWFMNKFPDKKKVIFLAPDMQMGRMVGGATVAMLKSIGMDISDEYYPVNQQDLSALGTKIKSINPDVVIFPRLEPMKAIRDAGWQGQFFCPFQYTVEQMAAMAPASAIEGLIGLSSPVEYDPPLNKLAQDFKAAYLQKTGKWETLDMVGSTIFYSVLASIQKAGSVDPDKVIAVLANGMTWDSASGTHKMVARPDMGNTRTVDSTSIFYMKEIKNGKAVLIDTISLDNASKYFSDYLATAPPPQAPPAAH